MKATTQQVLVFLFALVLVSCTGGKESTNKSALLVGNWKVQWVTDPSAYPDAALGTNFTMNGVFSFQQDGKIMITAQGYDNCVFSGDTLSHSLNWQLQGDTILSMTNEGDAHGITYAILSLTENKVKLQLMEDIFLNLTK